MFHRGNMLQVCVLQVSHVKILQKVCKGAYRPNQCPFHANFHIPFVIGFVVALSVLLLPSQALLATPLKYPLCDITQILVISGISRDILYLYLYRYLTNFYIKLGLRARSFCCTLMLASNSPRHRVESFSYISEG